MLKLYEQKLANLSVALMMARQPANVNFVVCRRKIQLDDNGAHFGPRN